MVFTDQGYDATNSTIQRLPDINPISNSIATTTSGRPIVRRSVSVEIKVAQRSPRCRKIVYASLCRAAGFGRPLVVPGCALA